MVKQLETRCAVCGEPIRTMRGAMVLDRPHMVCRKCFGKQTYGKPVLHGEHMKATAPPAARPAR